MHMNDELFSPKGFTLNFKLLELFRRGNKHQSKNIKKHNIYIKNKPGPTKYLENWKKRSAPTICMNPFVGELYGKYVCTLISSDH